MSDLLQDRANDRVLLDQKKLDEREADIKDLPAPLRWGMIFIKTIGFQNTVMACILVGLSWFVIYNGNQLREEKKASDAQHREDWIKAGDKNANFMVRQINVQEDIRDALQQMANSLEIKLKLKKRDTFNYKVNPENKPKIDQPKEVIHEKDALTPAI